MISKSHLWQKTAMAAAAAALFGLLGSNAAALSLGRITVQSALGEPLRAEIDVPEINAEEAASLKASVALPDAFRAAGLEYSPAMTGVQITLKRRPDGRAFIRVSSDRAINDPFVDMIVEASWSTGRIVRDYTMLFDPPSLRQAAPAAPTPAQIPLSPSASRAAAPESVPPASPTVTTTRPAEPAKGSAKAPVRAPMTKMASDASESGQVTVKPGDTASKIATATKSANISLDQMLVAMLRANPAAFMGDNINRVKSGSVINIPTAEQAGATSAQDASQIIIAQSKDFNAFRRQLAGSIPNTPLAAADRKVSGSVQAKVEDKKSVTVAPDKLKLSKGALQGSPAEDKLAKERSAKEADSRAAEIAKNISDLNKLGAASSAVAPATATPAKPDVAAIAAPVLLPIQSVSAPVSAALVPLPAVSSAASAPVTLAASAPQAAASAVAKRVPAVAVPQPQAETSFIDGLLENPLVPAGAVGLITLLAGFGFYRYRQRKNSAQVDSSFLDSRLQPDSFFGASGGQSIDTNDTAATGSSMVYSPSQLDAVDDVDPVAEADVYLAYGRDLQAEEILKDALRSNPGRIAIHQKLLEIFAKRRDTQGFEALATQAFKITNGNGPDWDRICELGLGIDPGNALYQPGGQPNNPDGSPSRPAPLEFSSSLASSADLTATQAIEPHVSETSDLDLDLDLDFSLDEQPVKAISETTASNAEPDFSALDLDFGLATEALAPFQTPQETPRPQAITDDIEFTLPDLDLPDSGVTPSSAVGDDFNRQAASSIGATGPAFLAIPEPEEASKPEETAAPDLGMLEFDLGSLSLDLGDSVEPLRPAAEPGAHEDPMATKLALAEEFSAIGDEDGARALIEEVIAEATGEMKIKAQRALSHL